MSDAPTEASEGEPAAPRRLGVEALDEPVPPDEIPEGVPGESRAVDVGEVRLHVVEAGPEDGKLLVLLHGFPEFWYGWHEAIAPLVNDGYRVVVPDQRGYNCSEKPPAVSDYRIDALAWDVVGLIDAYDRETAAVAGHDWGAAVGWWLALHHADRVSEFVAVNVPHPTVFERALRTSWDQRLKSWYVLAFQLPKLPEAVASAGNWRLAVRGLRDSSDPGTFGDEDIRRYRRAWNRDGAFEAMVNWYRAIVRDRPTPETETVEVPTLVIWGAKDRFLSTRLAGQSVDRCTDGRLLTLDTATHWVIHEEPHRVAEAIADHADPLPPGARE
ncbi:alpha/beta fold hydrolase [Halorubrum kocurii]|uniref:Alpha/beta hydrolase fold protein n=1 Tax=Halorubrum kocurii JCM 14978 TaxID=1230456 RepID=M0P2Q1_9EURY|nr:alpha/beta hydrolase [Halorubrum kocurii]EMA64366.1 alpha/beta hydrolase fold protein [Halorubrum kocurii JCM 14978]